MALDKPTLDHSLNLELGFLLEHYPGVLPSVLMKEDMALLFRPVHALSLYRAFRSYQKGDFNAMSDAETQMVFPLLKEVERE